MIDIYIGGNYKYHKETIQEVCEVAASDASIESLLVGVSYLPYVSRANGHNDVYAIINHRSDSYYPELTNHIVNDINKKYSKLITGYVYVPSKIIIKNEGIQAQINDINQFSIICNKNKQSKKLFIYPSILNSVFNTQILFNYAKDNDFGLIIGSPYYTKEEVFDFYKNQDWEISPETSVMCDSTLTELDNYAKFQHNYCLSMSNLNK